MSGCFPTDEFYLTCPSCQIRCHKVMGEESYYLCSKCLQCYPKEKNKIIDNVNHPHHYTSSKAACPVCRWHIECIDVVRHMDFNIGNAIKYLWRYEQKNGIEDLQKAIWYINDQIKKLEALEATPTRLPESKL